MSNNKLIAEFMGADPDKKIFFHTGQEVYFYHTSWDWLMPVVIECFNRFSNTDTTDHMRLNDALLTCNINELYESVVEFIKAQNKYPFYEGDDYWVLEDGDLVWSVWDDASEDMHDENPDKKYFTNEQALDFAKTWGVKYKK